MWSARTERLNESGGLRFGIERDSRPATLADVLSGWQADGGFRTFFNGLLNDAPYRAFRWETPAATRDTLAKPFEFVLLDAPNLDRTPDIDAFAEHFQRPDQYVAVFSNLSGDATMIVPYPLAATSCYGHLAAFVRNAPEPQRGALWEAVGTTLAKRVNDQPVWLSTAGAGVSWLHVRLDERPKYYGFQPYRAAHR